MLDGATAKSTKYAMTYSCCFCGTTFVVYKRNIKHLLCLHSLMQTLEGVWEKSEVFVYINKLSSSPKLPLAFASGYVNMACILYFLTNFYKVLYGKWVSLAESGSFCKSPLSLVCSFQWCVLIIFVFLIRCTVV